MQTIKWGPSAWKLFRAISSEYPNKPIKEDEQRYCCFFEHVGNILPCIYCRISHRQFIKELPMNDWLHSRYCVEYHLYLIHNKVNDKLRKQGYLKKKNPSFKKVKQMYDKPKIYEDCGWDFLYAVVYNYPITPNGVDKYNYKLFFEQLYNVLPYQPAKLAYQSYFDQHPVTEALTNRTTLTEWFYNLHRKIMNDLIKHGHLNKDTKMPCFSEICEKYENFRAACNVKASNSCRLPDTHNNINHEAQHEIHHKKLPTTKLY